MILKSPAAASILEEIREEGRAEIRSKVNHGAIDFKGPEKSEEVAAKVSNQVRGTLLAVEGTAQESSRASLLREGGLITEDDLHPDPLDDFETINALQTAYWGHFSSSGHTHEHIGRYGRNTPHGHAIDMILTKIGWLAVTSQNEPRRKTYRDLAVYAAIAFDVALRTPLGEPIQSVGVLTKALNPADPQPNQKKVE